MNEFELSSVSLYSTHGVMVQGDVEFCRSIRLALDLLSTKEFYLKIFTSSVIEIREVQGLRHTAQMNLAPGRGRIDVDRLNFQSMNTVDSVLMLAHESYHNHLYQDYFKVWGAWRAKKYYHLELPLIEKQCINYELSLAYDLGSASPDHIQSLELLSQFLQHPKMINEQYAAIRSLRSFLLSFVPEGKKHRDV